jgi:hypothetical protein
VGDFANELRKRSHDKLADRITDAVETGSTGSEILMHLRIVLRAALGDATITDADQQTARGLLADIEGVL